MKIKVERLASESSQRFASERGFTMVQSLITVALVALISAFAVMAVGSARASMRLTGSTREFAGYLEKARSNAIRRNGTSIVTIVTENSYSVTMDFDGDGVTETRTISLQEGVTFDGGVGVTATFDWRGRLGGAIRFVLKNDRGLESDLQLSGSGDVTIGNEAFEDHEIGGVTLNSDVPGGSPDPDDDGTTPSPSPVTTPPDGDPYPSPSPVDDPSPTASPVASPAASPSASPSASPAASPSASPSASPTSSPSQGVCTLTAPSSLTLPKNASPKSFSGVSITNANQTVVTATVSGDISEISPTSTTLSGNGSITYTVKYANGTNKSGSVTISSSCGTKVITITFP